MTSLRNSNRIPRTCLRHFEATYSVLVHGYESQRTRSPGWSPRAYCSISYLRLVLTSIHSRLDLLTSALCLSNQVEASMKKQRPSKKRKITITSAATRKKRERPKNAESAYHFIAYVPLQDKVWQLDGLQTDPRCVGKCFLAPFFFIGSMATVSIR